MSQGFVLAVAVAITGWWFFTGVILWLVHAPTAKTGWVFTAWSLALGPILLAVHITADSFTSSHTVMSFTLALLLWGWLELGYLTGRVTGPNSAACPDGAGLGQRLRLGLGTCLYHEIALIVLVFLLAIVSWDMPNQTALWTFSTLWLMRWSAKLNLVLGVRNYNKNWLPAHLGYLDSYIPKRAMNSLFPVSFIAGLAVTVMIAMAAVDAVTMPERISLTLVGALVALGTLEHVFLMLPLRDAWLWQWAAPDERDMDEPTAIARKGVANRSADAFVEGIHGKA